MKRIWYFIDIDGCIMDSLFGNDAFYTDDWEKINNLIKCYKRSKEISLYDEFIEWYKKITKKENISIYFITGRQNNCLGWLTEWQLRYLRFYYSRFKIIYYYDYKDHTWEGYKHFKRDSIFNILRDHHANSEDIINIYDDLDISIELLALENPINFHLITKPEDWEKL